MVKAKPGSWLYHSEVLTDQSPEDMCTNTIREKLLDYLPQEVPYTMTQVMMNTILLIYSFSSEVALLLRVKYVLLNVYLITCLSYKSSYILYSPIFWAFFN